MSDTPPAQTPAAHTPVAKTPPASTPASVARPDGDSLEAPAEPPRYAPLEDAARLIEKYLNDPRKAKPEDLRTEVWTPVCAPGCAPSG